MKTYAIIVKFNIFEESSYAKFYEKIEELKGYKAFTGLYFVHTDKSAKEIRNMLYPTLEHDSLLQNLFFILEIGDDFSGYSYYSDIAWLKEHKQELK